MAQSNWKECRVPRGIFGRPGQKHEEPLEMPVPPPFGLRKKSLLKKMKTNCNDQKLTSSVVEEVNERFVQIFRILKPSAQLQVLT